MQCETFEFPEHVESYLQDHNVLNLSTSGSDGPWSSAVFFAHHDLHFWFMSNPDTRHGKHILELGRMGASVHEDYGSWQEIKGLQMQGSVWLVKEEAERKAGLKAFFRKFCFAEAFFRSGVPEELKARMRNIHLFCFRPDVVYWLDNSSGFGNRQCIYPQKGSDG